MPTADPIPQPADFLHADDVCGYLLKNLEIQYQAESATWTRDQAILHFKSREHLIRVRGMLVTAAEHSAKS